MATGGEHAGHQAAWTLSTVAHSPFIVYSIFREMTRGNPTPVGLLQGQGCKGWQAFQPAGTGWEAHATPSFERLDATPGSPPLLIGLTGNIATGKSTVAGMLAELGAEVIDADRVAHEVMRAGSPVHTQIVAAFGPEVLGADGEIDRRRLGEIVFADPAALARLEALVHPAVIAEVGRRIAASSAPVVVVEAIKLIESGMAEGCDSVWVTTCQPDQQIRRLTGGRKMSRAEARRRVQAQPPQEDKIARADVVIDTDGTLAQTRAQVQAAWEQLVGRGCAGR